MDGVNQYVSLRIRLLLLCVTCQSLLSQHGLDVLSSFHCCNIPDTHPLMDIWIVAQSLSGKVRFVF